MKQKNKILTQFSQYLFWDVDIENVDLQKHKKFLINKVLQYGTYSDWKILVSIYGFEKIIETAKMIRDLDPKTIAFLSVVGNTPKSEFTCFTTKPSAPKHWNF